MGAVDRMEAEGWADFLRYAEDESQVRRAAPDVRDALIRLIEEDGGRLRQRLTVAAEAEAVAIRETAYREARDEGRQQGQREADALLRLARNEAGELVDGAKRRAKAILAEAQSRADRILAPLQGAAAESAKRIRHDEQRAAQRLKAAEAEVERVLAPVRDADLVRGMLDAAERDIVAFLTQHDADVKRWREAAKGAINRDLAAARAERDRARRDAVRIRRAS